MQKTKLIVQIQTERRDLEKTLAKLNSEQWNTPLSAGGWSVKDTLAHLAAWQQQLADWLLTLSDESDPHPCIPYGLDDEALDQLNDQIYCEQSDKTLAEVLSFFRSTYQRSLKIIKATPDELFSQSISLEGQMGPQVWVIIAANTSEHDQEHHNDIIDWLYADSGS